MLLGDVTLDGKINIVDALSLFAGVSGRVELESDQLAVADMNGDGKVNLVDAVLLFKHVSGR